MTRQTTAIYILTDHELEQVRSALTAGLYLSVRATEAAKNGPRVHKQAVKDQVELIERTGKMVRDRLDQDTILIHHGVLKRPRKKIARTPSNQTRTRFKAQKWISSLPS